MKKTYKITTLILVVILVVTLCVTLTSCKKNPTTSDELIVGSTMKISTLNRLDAAGGAAGYGYDIIAASLSQLTPVYQDGDSYKAMLCDYTESTDGLSWKFKVKDGFTWHDGETVTNQDLMFTLEEQYDKGIDYANIEEKDGFVVVTLNTPNPRFLSRISSMRLYPKHLFEGKTFETLKDEDSVVGCGPFKHVLYDENKNILKFEKYEDYPYADNISINKVIIKFYNSKDVLNLALKNGEIDMMYNYQQGLTKTEIADFGNNSNIEVFTYDSKKMPKNIFFNSDKTDKDVRKAISKAIDYKAIRNIFGSKTVVPTNEGFIPKAQSKLETLELKRDLEKAREILRSKGYSESNKYQFELLVNSGKDDSQYASVLKTQIEETGLIDVTINSKSQQDWKNYIFNGQHQACLATITAKGFDMQAGVATKYFLAHETEALMGNPVCFANYKLTAGGKNTPFGDVYFGLVNAKTKAQYDEAIKSYETFMVEETPAIALYFDKMAQAYSNKLSGFFVEGGFDLFNVKTFETLVKEI